MNMLPYTLLMYIYIHCGLCFINIHCISIFIDLSSNRNSVMLSLG